MEQRKHTRHQVEFPGTFSDGGGSSGSGMVIDLSSEGCRVRRESAIVTGNYVRLLINLRGRDIPLTVSLAVIRWSTGNEFGVEFIRMTQDEQRLLRHVITTIEAKAIGEEQQAFN